MATPIEQMEAAGILDASGLSAEVRDRINASTSQETVDHLIKFKKSIDKHTSHPQPKKWKPGPDGSML